MKLVRFTSFLFLVFKIRFPTGLLRYTINLEEDSFQHWLYIVMPCEAFAFVVQLAGSCLASYYCDLSALELLWTFSITLEPIAMVPQLVILHFSNDQPDRLLRVYIFGMWFNKGLLLLNWVYRYNTEKNFISDPYLFIFVGCHEVITPVAWMLKSRRSSDSEDCIIQSDTQMNSLSYALMDEVIDEEFQNKSPGNFALPPSDAKNVVRR